MVEFASNEGGESRAALASARAGDRTSFESVVLPHVRSIRAHCYRMLGSLAEAEDVTQETLLRAWRGIGGFDGRSALRTWLYRIATNACLSHLERSPRRGLPDSVAAASPPGPPSAPVAENLWIEPCPAELWSREEAGADAKISLKESVTIAFLTAIQELTPAQRAVLIFRDVLGWSANETAASLGTTPTAVHSALVRAREALGHKDEEPASSRMAKAGEDGVEHALLVRYIRAWESGDMRAVADLLREDARLTMPPFPAWYSGRDAIISFLELLGAQNVRALPGVASGSPAAFAYKLSADGVYMPHCIHVLDLAPDGRCARLDVFVNARLFPLFGFPSTLRS